MQGHHKGIGGCAPRKKWRHAGIRSRRSSVGAPTPPLRSMASAYLRPFTTGRTVFSAASVPGELRDEVFVSALPLTATPGPPQLLMSAAYSLKLWDLRHYVVVLRPRFVSPHPAQVFVYDFQPKDPENVYVALAALSRNRVPGVILKRKLVRLPKTKCWFVGFCQADNSLDLADKFSDQWSTDLLIGEHDCRHYTNGLVECLTGEADIVKRLRYNRNGK